MVNREVIELIGSGERTETRFLTSTHQKFFYIILVDFLSPNSDVSLTQDRVSCMGLLDKVLKQPLLAAGGSDSQLREAVMLFQAWLQQTVAIKLWAPNLNVELPINLTRHEIINISGNMAKHHFGHLTSVISKINAALDESRVPRHDLVAALEDIYGNLNDNILNYHGSTVAEMMNNIRWGIHSYLLPEFDRAYRKKGPMLYEYNVPQEITSDLAISCYWGLMNSVRKEPDIKKFTVSGIPKSRY